MLSDLCTMPAISEYDLASPWFAKMSFFSSRVKQLRAFTPSCLKIVPTMLTINQN